mmetsp:Transcript_2132/g.3525  ORF Transcript_2132/g.3525 Transcript_2132/m.3525 type:complete len:95 (+) Transcript_2132:884-1168(+)
MRVRLAAPPPMSDGGVFNAGGANADEGSAGASIGFTSTLAEGTPGWLGVGSRIGPPAKPVAATGACTPFLAGKEEALSGASHGFELVDCRALVI